MKHPNYSRTLNILDLLTKPSQLILEPIPHFAFAMAANGETSEALFHIKRTLINLKKDRTGAVQEVAIKGTYTNLAAAKAAAKETLFDEGYDREFFSIYDVKDNHEGEVWKHGDECQVYAVAPESGIFRVEIETSENRYGFVGGADGKVDQELYHVLQTTIHYNLDRSGARRDVTIEDTLGTAEQARQRALEVLLDEDVTKESFEKYDENMGQEDWPFDEDILVHAVGSGGENYLVQVIKEEATAKK